MKKTSTIILQVAMVLFGMGVLTFLLWEPQIEGRNVNATFFEIYFKDPFLAYMYIASIAFFVALYKAFRIFGYIRQNKIFSESTAKALRTIKYSALALVIFFIGAEAYFFIVVRGTDDIAGGVAIALFLMLVSAAIASVAAIFERTLRNVLDIKSENDFTV